MKDQKIYVLLFSLLFAPLVGVQAAMLPIGHLIRLNMRMI